MIGTEVLAETFEITRRRIWQRQYVEMLKLTFVEPAPFDINFLQEFWWDDVFRHYGYIVGDIVSYNSEVWICHTNHPAIQDPPGTWKPQNTIPGESGMWSKWADPRKYSSFDMNSGRYLAIGDNFGNRSVVPAYVMLPLQLLPDKQLYGPFTWQPYVFYDLGVTVKEPNADIYKKAKVPHISTPSGDADNWQVITKQQAEVGCKHRSPVEIRKAHVTGPIGAIYPWFNPPQSGPTPHYYSYHLEPYNEPPVVENQRYANPKYGFTGGYQSHIETLANLRKWAWMNPPEGYDESQRAAHYLGWAEDPSGVQGIGGVSFNRCAFEEILHLYGKYDWYLDMNVPPQITQNPYNPLMCWRRTWRYSMQLPAGLESTRTYYVVNMAAVPEINSTIKIGDYSFKFVDGATEIFANHAFVQLGWNVENAIINLAEAINSSPVYAQAQAADRLYVIADLQRAGELVCAGRSKCSIYYQQRYGGVTYMWPQEWGTPPIPAGPWYDISACMAMLNELDTVWQANPEMQKTMLERHTCEFYPWQNFDHSEIVSEIMTDCDAVLEWLKYTIIGASVHLRPVYMEAPAPSEIRKFDSWGEAERCFYDKVGAWIPYTDPGPPTNGWGTPIEWFGMSGGIYSFLDDSGDLEDWKWRVSPDEYDWFGGGGAIQNIAGAGFQARVASDELYYEWGLKTLVVRIAVYGDSIGVEYTTPNWDTVRRGFVTVEGAGITKKANDWTTSYGWVEMPVTPYTANGQYVWPDDCVTILPRCNFDFFTHEEIVQFHGQSESWVGRLGFGFDIYECLLPYQINEMDVNS